MKKIAALFLLSLTLFVVSVSAHGSNSFYYVDTGKIWYGADWYNGSHEEILTDFSSVVNPPFLTTISVSSKYGTFTRTTVRSYRVNDIVPTGTPHTHSHSVNYNRPVIY